METPNGAQFGKWLQIIRPLGETRFSGMIINVAEFGKSEISPNTNLWDSSFILKGLGGKHGVNNSLHAWVFETDAIKPSGKKKGKSVKFTHTHGVVAKCNFVIKVKNKKAFQSYTGLFDLDKNQNKKALTLYMLQRKHLA